MDAKNEKPSQLGAAHCSEAPRGSVCENGCPSSPASPETENRGKEARQTLNKVGYAGSCLCQETNRIGLHDLKMLMLLKEP